MTRYAVRDFMMQASTTAKDRVRRHLGSRSGSCPIGIDSEFNACVMTYVRWRTDWTRGYSVLGIIRIRSECDRVLSIYESVCRIRRGLPTRHVYWPTISAAKARQGRAPKRSCFRQSREDLGMFPLVKAYSLKSSRSGSKFYLSVAVTIAALVVAGYALAL